MTPIYHWITTIYDGHVVGRPIHILDKIKHISYPCLHSPDVSINSCLDKLPKWRYIAITSSMYNTYVTNREYDIGLNLNTFIVLGSSYEDYNKIHETVGSIHFKSNSLAKVINILLKHNLLLTDVYVGDPALVDEMQALRCDKSKIVTLVSSSKSTTSDEKFTIPSGYTPIKTDVLSSTLVQVTYAMDKISPELAYTSLMEDVLLNGEIRETRNGPCLSSFAKHLKVDIEHYLPVLTTKFVPWKSCVEELLWFLRGSTNSLELEAKGVNIWKGNTRREFLDSVGLNHLPEGELGRGYGYQWRNFGGYIDQIKNVIESIKQDPTSRRHIVSAWNPCDLTKVALPPCHSFFQFYVSSDKKLSCHLYQRSADIFLGLPWNIMSYSLLTYIIAMKTGLKPKSLTISIGDAHIYECHINACKQQLNVSAFAPPIVVINEDVTNLDFSEMKLEHFKLVNYFHQPAIRAPMIA